LGNLNDVTRQDQHIFCKSPIPFPAGVQLPHTSGFACCVQAIMTVLAHITDP
jgi:hypothetical protein